jgi:tryptophan 2,3-dioxygenase
MTTDYAAPILAGDGDTDYARYMRTDALLSLQRLPEEMVHRDELLFQTVHQSTELWLKHGCYETTEAAARMRGGDLGTAILLLGRAALGIELVTGQLEMLRLLAPKDFRAVRTVLGHGSGFESPGWRGVQLAGRQLREAFTLTLLVRGTDPGELYRSNPAEPLYRLAEALVEWDERVCLWRTRHYGIVRRIIGEDVVGTKGTPARALTRLIDHTFFPDLWQARTDLTNQAPPPDAGWGYPR